MLDLEFLLERGVTFPVLDATQSIADEPTWNGWIEDATSTVIAVSVARGADPSDPEVELTKSDSGMVVWSFDPDQLRGDSYWPASAASLFFSLEFVHRRGIGIDDGMSEMDEIVHHGGQSIDITVDGLVMAGKLCEFPLVGAVVFAVTPTLAVAAAFFMTPPTTAFHTLAP